TGSWTTSGTGTFANIDDPSTIYYPSPADTTAGIVILTLTSTNIGLCIAESDSMVISIDTGIYVNAGLDTTLCSNNALTNLNGSVTGRTNTGVWASSGTGSFIPDSAQLSVDYIPSTGDTAGGQVELILTSTNNDFCEAVSDTLLLTLTPAPYVNAGSDKYACRNNASTVLNGKISAGATTGEWSTSGTGTFSPDAQTLNATYTASPEDTAASDYVTLVLISTNNDLCLAESDTLLFHFTEQPVANAGPDTIICANNNNVILDGQITGGAGTGQWSSSGTGTFIPHIDSLSAIYEFSAADTIAGSVTIVLTSTNVGGCLPEYDTVEITIPPAPWVEAGNNVSVCANNDTVQLDGKVWGATSTGIWTTPGTGQFVPDETTLNAIYLPSDEDTILGTFPIYLTSTNHGDCQSAIDLFMLTITTLPVADAGDDVLICKGDTAYLNGNVYGGTNTGLWNTSGTGLFLPNSSSMEVAYVPSIADTASDFLDIILVSTNNGQCLPAYDTVRINMTTLPFVEAGPDVTVCANNAEIQLDGLVTGSATTGIWTTSGTGIFSPVDTLFDARYIPSASDTALGSVFLFLNATYSCQASDSLLVTITPAPYVNAGPNQSICIDDAIINLNGTVYGATTTGIWSTSGSGSFQPEQTTIDATYIRSPGDSIAGSVTLTLTSTNHGNCIAVSDFMTVTMSELPVVNAGNDYSYCSNNANILLNGYVGGESSTGQWSTLGSGSFTPNVNTLNATYIPSSADTSAHEVTLVLKSTNTCIVIRDTVHYNLTPAPYVDAGGDPTVCANNSNVYLDGNIAGATTTGQWYTSGSGVFLPNSTALDAIYSPSTSDKSAGHVNLILVSTNFGMCFPVKDTIVVTVLASPVVDAGQESYICTYESIILDGSVSGVTTTGRWSTSGSGIFVPNDSVLDATYIPSPADTVAQTISLTLASTNNGCCNEVTDMLALHITPKPVVIAGNDRIVCANNSNVLLEGIVSGTSTTGKWTTLGAGTFQPSSTTLGATYFPGQADINNGEVTLVLSSTFACLNTDTMKITITPAPLVNAGQDQYFCENEALVQLNGSVTLGASTGIWTTIGSGYFTPNDTIFNPVYYPSSQDTANGSVTLYLTSTHNGDCLEEDDYMTAYFAKQPAVDAGVDQTVCANNLVDLTGEVLYGTETGFWSTNGTGMFYPSKINLYADYLFSAQDTTNEELNIILTSDSLGSCQSFSDSMVVTVTPAPYIEAGNDVSVCENNDTVFLNGHLWGATTTGTWFTSGSGTFIPDSALVNPIYIPSIGDIIAGSVTLYLRSTNDGNCYQVTDSMKVTIFADPDVNAGADQYLCAGDNIYLDGIITGITTSGRWETNGTGIFVPDNTVLGAPYIPSPQDTVNGTVEFRLDTT
ncbi:MAG: hypothetical protein HY738_15545, partial [Bacteroidia bacterium]|nr:hypothetical protein [Bacteroidia bacterium]